MRSPYWVTYYESVRRPVPNETVFQVSYGLLSMFVSFWGDNAGILFNYSEVLRNFLFFSFLSGTFDLLTSFSSCAGVILYTTLLIVSYQFQSAIFRSIFSDENLRELMWLTIKCVLRTRLQPTANRILWVTLALMVKAVSMETLLATVNRTVPKMSDQKISANLSYTPPREGSYVLLKKYTSWPVRILSSKLNYLFSISEAETSQKTR